MMNTICKITGYKINTQQPSINKQTEKSQGISTFTIASKALRYPGVNLTNGMKDLCNGNIRKTLKEKTENNTTK